jgi:hypothetical protein
MKLSEVYWHYVEIFRTDIDRFLMSCPDCKQGCNSAPLGGSKTCFHCDNCGLVECMVTSPALLEIHSISEHGEGK